MTAKLKKKIRKRQGNTNLNWKLQISNTSRQRNPEYCIFPVQFHLFMSPFIVSCHAFFGLPVLLFLSSEAHFTDSRTGLVGAKTKNPIQWQDYGIYTHGCTRVESRLCTA